MTEELKQLREALRRVKYEAVSLADAQVIALEALNCLTAMPPQQAAGEPVARVELMQAGGNAGLATRIVEIDDPLRERLRPDDLLFTHPAPGVPDWAECLRISETPDVDEALRLFAEGETSEDQAVCIVRAVLAAAQAKENN